MSRRRREEALGEAIVILILIAFVTLAKHWQIVLGVMLCLAIIYGVYRFIQSCKHRESYITYHQGPADSTAGQQGFSQEAKSYPQE